MNVDLIQILNPIGNAVVTRIQQNLASSGENATGQTSRSLRFIVTQEDTITRFQIIGRPYFMTVETGRKATPDKKPSKAMVERIQEWMKAKGLPGKAYGIAMAIQKKGTKLHQVGGRKDIVTPVIPEAATAIEKAVLKQFVNQYLTLVNSSKPSARA